MKSQMPDEKVFTPIAKDGPITLEIDVAGRLVVTDGILTSWITFYPRSTWRLDGALAVTGKVRDMVNRLDELQRRASGKGE